MTDDGCVKIEDDKDELITQYTVAVHLYTY